MIAKINNNLSYKNDKILKKNSNKNYASLNKNEIEIKKKN